MFRKRVSVEMIGHVHGLVRKVVLCLLLGLGGNVLAQEAISPVWPDQPGYGGTPYTMLTADATNMEVRADVDITGVDWARDTSASNAFLFFRVWVREQTVSQLTSVGHAVFLDLSGDDLLIYALYNTTLGAGSSELGFWNTNMVPHQWDLETIPPAREYSGGTRDFDKYDDFIEMAVPSSDIGVVPEEVYAYSFGKGAMDLHGDTNNAPSGDFFDTEVSVTLSIDQFLYGTGETNVADSTGSEVQIGETVTYQLDVTMSQGVITNLSVTNYLPDGLAFAHNSVVVDTNDFTGALGALAVTPTGTSYAVSGEDVALLFQGASSVPTGGDVSNQMFHIRLDALVLDTNGVAGLPPDASVLTNTASVTYSNNPDDPALSDAVTVSVIEPEVSTAMSGYGVTASVAVCYWTMTNSGTATAFEPEWMAALDGLYWTTNGLAVVPPAGFASSVTNSGGDIVVRVMPDAGYSPPVTSIEAGEALTIALAARLLPAVTSPVPIEASVEIYSTLEGSNSNERTRASQVTQDSITYEQTVDVAVTDAVSPSAAYEGDPVVFTVSATNTGPDEAVDITIDVALPASFDEGGAVASAGTYTNGVWSLPYLATGEVAELTLNASVGTGLTAPVISHTATLVTNRPSDTVSGNNVDSASVDVMLQFSILGMEPDGATNMVISWEGRDGFTYGLARGTNLLGTLVPVTNGLPGVSPLNVYTDTVPHSGAWMYRVYQE